MDKQLAKFASDHSWEAQMRNRQGIDSFDNYSGPNLGNLVVVLGRNRDSDAMSESNFEVALERLGGPSKHVLVERFGHWACGWFELILVNPKHLKSLRIAYQISKDLEGYPVLDESDYFERQTEQHNEYAERAKRGLAEALSKHFGVKVSNSLKGIAYSLNMACQSYYGDDSCVNIYAHSEPDKDDLDRLKICMREIECNYKDSKVFKAIMARILWC